VEGKNLLVGLSGSCFLLYFCVGFLHFVLIALLGELLVNVFIVFIKALHGDE